jgi:hypothetical protein
LKVSDRENRTLGEGEREGNPHSTTEAGGMDDTSTDAIRESIKLGFESVKHLTTLSAGSTVLIATFLKDIFPNIEDLSAALKWAISGAFIAFGMSLVVAVACFWAFAVMLRSQLDFHTSTLRVRYRLSMALPSYFYICGLMLFSLAVLFRLLKPGPLGSNFLLGSFTILIVTLTVFLVWYVGPKRVWEAFTEFPKHRR